MTNAIFEEMIRRGARKLAKRHIQEALHSSFFKYENCLLEIDRNYWKRKSYNFIFDNAYSEAWYQIGADDAVKGLRRFGQIAGYCIGWNLQIIEMTRAGWINPWLVKKHGFKDYGGKDFSSYVKALKHEVEMLDI